MSDGRARLRFALSTLGLVAAAWSATLVVTRGVSFSIGALHVSSRNARNPALGALLLVAIAVCLAPPRVRWRTVAEDVLSVLRGTALVGTALRPIPRLLAALTRPRALTTFAMVVVGLTLWLAYSRGAFIVGGSDSYGYVSEAHLIATGRMRAEVPLARSFPHVPLQAFTPLGYRPADDGTNTLVPTYAPGLPLAMAAAERIGGMDAVYVVMPLLAAVAVWAAYLIGARLSGPGVGLGAALLVFASPAFVFQLISAPMSDVCAAGYWTLAVALLLRDSRWSAAASGAAAGAAILTRPNLLLVVVILGLYLLWLVINEERARRRERLTRLALFSSPVVIACLVVAGFNAVWYGSPLRSGYSSALFGAHFWSANIRNFSTWLIETQTPLFFLGFAAPLVARWLPERPGMHPRAVTVMLTGVVLTVFVSYLFYTPFEAWWFLRFLVPGFPVMAVLTCLTLAALSARFGMAARVLSVAAVIGAAAFGWSMIQPMETLGENRYRIVAEWVRDRLPANAIIFASQHSGNVKHYSGREIVRYDLLPAGNLEPALDEIIAAGYRPYLVIDEWEVPNVRNAHGAGPRGAIDWPPIAMLPLANLSVWDLAEDREAARASRRTPELIPIPEFIRRQLP